MTSIPKLQQWFYVSESILYAIAILIFAELLPDWGRWYLPQPHLRDQTTAFLRGELSLSIHPENLGHDLCWTDQGVQQVWGLGIPLWQLPWEACARLLNKPPFPDRVAFALFLMLTAYVIMRTFVPDAFAQRDRAGPGPGQMSMALGATLGFLAFPPFLSLLSCRGAIFEEVLSYVYLFGALLASGTMALAKSPTWTRYWFLCALAGLGALIRPTLFFYGLATVATSSLVMGSHCAWQTAGRADSKKPAKVCMSISSFWVSLGLGAMLFVGGGGLLWFTNLLRFGDGFEFGHRLNLQRGTLFGSVYATRFDYPFSVEPMLRSARELSGALFRVHTFNSGNWYAEGIFGGQSPTVRWREFYFTTFHLGYVPLLILGWITGGRALYKQWKHPPLQNPESGNVPERVSENSNSMVGAEVTRPQMLQKSPRLAGEEVSLLTSPTFQTRSETETPPRDVSELTKAPEFFNGPGITTSGVLALWSMLAFVPLALFYMHTPVISSRYMMDFAPAFAAAIVLAWWWMISTVSAWSRWGKRLRVALWIVLLTGFGWEVCHSESAYGPPTSFTREDITRMQEQRESQPEFTALPVTYQKGENLETLGIPYNGAGWETNGALRVTAILFVESPDFLELDLAPAPGHSMETSDPTQIRAKVGLEFLHLESLVEHPEGWRIRFARPKLPRYQKGLQPVFLATVPGQHLAEDTTPWLLHRVSWRSARHTN